MASLKETTIAFLLPPRLRGSYAEPQDRQNPCERRKPLTIVNGEALAVKMVSFAD
jgi:hypothetical protein